MKNKLLILYCFLSGLLTTQAQINVGAENWDYEAAKKIMSQAYWDLWSPDVQKKIDENIDKYRKADALLNFADLDPGTEVRIEQIASQFVFGANIFNFDQLGTKERNRRYKEVFGTLFNSATIPFYWKKFEMQPDQPRFKQAYWDTEEYWNNVAEPKRAPHWRRPAPDPIIEYCEANGVRMHGHTMVWGNRNWHHPEWLFNEFASDEEKEVMRGWMTAHADEKEGILTDKFTDAYQKMTPEQIAGLVPDYGEALKRLFEKRVVELGRYYGDRLPSWDIANESATDFSNGVMIPGDAICKSHYGIMPGDYTYEAFKVAEQVLPENVLLNINDYKNDDSYVEQINDLLARGRKIDILGSQMHLFDPQQCEDIAEGKKIETPQIVWDKMNVLSKAKLPIHLSEITVTAPGDDARGRAIQAVVSYNLYRLWFSIENMMGITWWNVVDDCGAPGEPTTSGLFTKNMEPKPSYFALNDLINKEWKTNLTVKTDSNSRVAFRGFKGKYRVTWKDKSGEARERILDLNEDGFN